MLSRFFNRFRNNRGLDAELADHLAQLKQERIDAGDPPEQAELYARRHLGNPALIHEDVYESTPLQPLETALRHASFALRTFRRNGSAYLFAIAILTLGIGMSVTMFSLVQAVLLKPLPFPDQDAIQVIWKQDQVAGVALVELAYPELGDLQALKAFDSVALMPTTLYGYGRVLDTGHGDPVQLEGTPVSHDFFRVLGVKPALGRDFTDADEQVNAAPVVVLSDHVWRKHFSADPAILGRQIRLNGAGVTVIGVTAPAIDFPRGVDIWLPLGVTPMKERRGATYLQAIARTRPGFSASAIQAQVASLFQRQARDYPQFYSNSQRAVVTPLPQYWTGSARIHLWISLGASLLLLIAACICASNLFLSRALARRREIATRTSLGAAPRHILAQFAVEGLTAAILAAVSGTLLAAALIRVLVLWAPADIPRLTEATLDPRGLAFALGTAALAALVCSFAPAWLITRLDLDALLREGGQRTAGSRTGKRLQRIFVMAQTAATVLLLSICVLLVVSYRAMLNTDVGFANRDTVTMNLALRGSELTAESRDAFYTRLLEKLHAVPGVTNAGAILLRPFEGNVGWDLRYEFDFEAGRHRNEELPSANYEVVTPGYLATVGTPLLEGRDFRLTDFDKAEPVVIISNALARQLRKSGHDPLGLRLRFGRRPDDVWWKVIGVAAEARYRRVTETGIDLYVNYLQTGIPTNYVVVRGTRPTQELVALVRQAAAEIDPRQAIAGTATLGDLIDRDTARHRFNMIVLVWFAACAVILAAAGVYSVITESLAVRTREIALKVALGAGRPRLLRELAGSALAFVVIGELLGLVAAAAAGRAATDLLYTVKPSDPLVLAAVFAFLFLVSTAAAIQPAWTAARRDPRAALQSD
ncbi:ADOP family duplicated permease [uncultured Paludibaculum sp.]|uniref:ADOP family duplicated permease n=1 Tax=uncultured Paludibaculum sp. TaxID=1765020 RepID=UPI002AAAC06F|nr:ADOP family duplicated permease [uncultured Paludibaculum sp.]